MYAIIADGPHQYRVEEGQELDVHLKDLEEGATSYEFTNVLLVGDLDDGPKIGQPSIDGAKVTATIVGEQKGNKLKVQKLRRRKNSRVKTGHRQKYLRVKIEKIEA